MNNPPSFRHLDSAFYSTSQAICPVFLRASVKFNIKDDFRFVFSIVNFFRVKIVKLSSKMRPPACPPKSDAPNQEPEPMHVFTDKNEGHCIISRKTLKIEVPKRTKQQQQDVAQPLQIAAKIDCGPW